MICKRIIAIFASFLDICLRFSHLYPKRQRGSAQFGPWGQAISYTVGFVGRKRGFWTEAQIVLSCTVEKGLFRLTFFRLSFSTGGSSRSLRVCQSKNSVEKVLHLLYEPIASLIPPQTPTHTPTHPYQVPHSSTIQQRRRFLGYYCCCFSPQVSVAQS